MEGTETRQRRLEGYDRSEEPGTAPSLSTERLPETSKDGCLEVPESQVAPKPLEAEPSGETALIIGLQVLVPFVFAGLGLSWAGILLNHFQVRGTQWGWGLLSNASLTCRQLYLGSSLKDKGKFSVNTIFFLYWTKFF